MRNSTQRSNINAILAVFRTLVRGMSVGILMPSSDSCFFSSSDNIRVMAFLEEEEEWEEERTVTSGDGGETVEDSLSESAHTHTQHIIRCTTTTTGSCTQEFTY